MPKRSITDATLIAIGQRLVWLREALGHTQADWARRLRIPAQQLNKWEKGGRLPNINALITICDASGASMDYLLRGIVTQGMPQELIEPLYRDHGGELRFQALPRRAQP